MILDTAFVPFDDLHFVSHELLLRVSVLTLVWRLRSRAACTQDYFMVEVGDCVHTGLLYSHAPDHA